MKITIPNTTESKPYIEFRFDKNGNLTLEATSTWWGGDSGSFICSDGSEGNTCLPKDLDTSIKKFKEKKVKDIEKKIQNLQKKLKKLKS